MRQADQDECWAAGVDPYTALADSRKRSDWSTEIWRNGTLLCEWGYRVDSVLTNAASVWMLSFDPMGSHTIFAGRESRRLLRELLKMFNSLQCEVHAKHLLALEWLEWLGFEFHTLTTLPNGEQFYTMRIERK